MNIPPASNTRYFDPARKQVTPLFVPLIFSTGKNLQNSDAASGSNASDRLEPSIPA